MLPDDTERLLLALESIAQSLRTIQKTHAPTAADEEAARTFDPIHPIERTLRS